MVTVTLPTTLFVEDAEPFALNLSDPLADVALRKSKSPMPAPMETEPLLEFAFDLEADVVVVSLITMVTMSPTFIAR